MEIPEAQVKSKHGPFFTRVYGAFKAYPLLLIPSVITLMLYGSIILLFDQALTDNAEENLLILFIEMFGFGLLSIVVFHWFSITLMQMIKNIEQHGFVRPIRSLFAIFSLRSFIMAPVFLFWIVSYVVLMVIFLLLSIIAGMTRSGDILDGAKPFFLVLMFFSNLYVFLLPPVMFNGFNLRKSFKEISAAFFNRSRTGKKAPLALIILFGMLAMLWLTLGSGMDAKIQLFGFAFLFVTYINSLLIVVSEQYLHAVKFMKHQAMAAGVLDVESQWDTMQKPTIGDKIQDFE